MVRSDACFKLFNELCEFESSKVVIAKIRQAFMRNRDDFLLFGSCRQ